MPTGTWKHVAVTYGNGLGILYFDGTDSAAAPEERALRILGGLDGLAPMPLASDLAGRWSAQPTVLLSRLAGEADITPTDPDAWANQLGRALANVHATPTERLSALPSVFDCSGGSPEVLEVPAGGGNPVELARLAASPDVLTHYDCWSGNVVWRDGILTGIVDWSGAARGPRGFDLGWCRLDRCLLFDERIADVFLAGTSAA